MFVGGGFGGGLAALFHVFHNLLDGTFVEYHLADSVRIGFENIGVSGFFQEDQLVDALGAEIVQTCHIFNKRIFKILAGFYVVIEFVSYYLCFRVLYNKIRTSGFIGRKGGDCAEAAEYQQQDADGHGLDVFMVLLLGLNFVDGMDLFIYLFLGIFEINILRYFLSLETYNILRLL